MKFVQKYLNKSNVIIYIFKSVILLKNIFYYDNQDTTLPKLRLNNISQITISNHNTSFYKKYLLYYAVQLFTSLFKKKINNEQKKIKHLLIKIAY